jgi:hypothetical protein
MRGKAASIGGCGCGVKESWHGSCLDTDIDSLRCGKDGVPDRAGLQGAEPNAVVLHVMLDAALPCAYGAWKGVYEK